MPPHTRHERLRSACDPLVEVELPVCRFSRVSDGGLSVTAELLVAARAVSERRRVSSQERVMIVKAAVYRMTFIPLEEELRIELSAHPLNGRGRLLLDR